MTYWEHGGVTLHCGDCRTVLASLPDGSVQCAVTSPPYFGLRDYGTAAWDGGDPACDHLGPPKQTQAGFNERYFGKASVASDKQAELRTPYRDTCGKCGAVRVDKQIGLEQTPGAYVAEMVAVMREVKRVLRDDGTLWLNLGDSYAGSWGNYSGQNRGKGGQREITVGSMPSKAWDGRERERPAASRKQEGIKEKDLIGIPWRVAFALQADGWWLRSDIIWHKPNPMPESVTDRPTRSHEYIFLLSKSARYYYDGAAIAEPIADSSIVRLAEDDPRKGSRVGENEARPTRNKRDVWTVATAPYAAAHFATFPPKLIEPCILAGCPPGGTVLDPFAGAGTTLLVAKDHNRQAIGIELNPAYCDLIVERCGQGVLPLAVTA